MDIAKLTRQLAEVTADEALATENEEEWRNIMVGAREGIIRRMDEAVATDHPDHIAHGEEMVSVPHALGSRQHSVLTVYV